MAQKSNATPEIKDKDYFKMASVLVSNSKIFADNIKQCRICLQPIQHNEVPGICRCKGDAAVSHEKCLIQWVKKTPQEQIHSQYFSMCEICKTPICLQTQNSLKCIKLDSFKLIKKESYCTVVIFILLFLGIVGLGVSIYGFSKNQHEQEIKGKFLVGIIISSTILFLDLCAYLVHVFTEFEVEIVGFRNFKEANFQKLRKSQTIPIVEIKNEIQNESSVTNLHDYPLQSYGDK